MLLHFLREAIRVRHYSIRTEKAYVGWARRFILFHNKRHPNDMGGVEVAAFLSHLALELEVSPATQIYTHVLKRGGMAVKSPLGDALRYSKI